MPSQTFQKLPDPPPASMWPIASEQRRITTSSSPLVHPSSRIFWVLRRQRFVAHFSWSTELLPKASMMMSSSLCQLTPSTTSTASSRNSRALRAKGIHSTLDEYSHVGLNELKRRFAALDLSVGPMVGQRSEAEVQLLLERLRPLGPQGIERAWTQLVDVLRGLATQEG